MRSFRYLLIVLLSFALVSCAHKKESFYFGNYSEAEHFFNKKDYEKAIQKYQAYIDENPEGNLAVISLYYIAKSHAALGHTEEAKTIFRKIKTQYPEAVWANFSDAQLKELEGNKPAAKTAAA